MDWDGGEHGALCPSGPGRRQASRNRALKLEDALLLAPLIAALTEYMAEKGHKWKSPDGAAASIDESRTCGTVPGLFVERGGL